MPRLQLRCKHTERGNHWKIDIVTNCNKLCASLCVDSGNGRVIAWIDLDRGLSENDALAALTTVPAQLCGVADRLGTIEPGKLANVMRFATIMAVAGSSG